MKRGGDVTGGYSIEEENHRWVRCKNKNDIIVPRKQSIPQHRRLRRGVSRGVDVVKENSRPILSRKEWDCLAEEVTWGGYKN